MAIASVWTLIWVSGVICLVIVGAAWIFAYLESTALKLERDAERKCRAEKAHGLLAKACVEEHLKVGETYEITTRERGKFGRYLATIRLSKRHTINDLLVKSLLAVPYHGQNKREVKAFHESNRKELVKQGVL